MRRKGGCITHTDKYTCTHIQTTHLPIYSKDTHTSKPEARTHDKTHARILQPATHSHRRMHKGQGTCSSTRAAWNLETAGLGGQERAMEPTRSGSSCRHTYQTHTDTNTQIHLGEISYVISDSSRKHRELTQQVHTQMHMKHTSAATQHTTNTQSKATQRPRTSMVRECRRVDSRSSLPERSSTSSSSAPSPAARATAS